MSQPNELIVFDLDGTLVDSESVYFEVLGELLKPYDLGPPEKVLEKTRSQPPEKLFDNVLGSKEGQVVLARLREIDKELYKKVLPFSGIIELLQELQRKGRPLALWTARDRFSASLVMENLKMDSFFPFWVSGSCVQENKPSAEGLFRVIDHFGVDCERVLMVGDHEHDIMAADSAGARPIHARWKHRPTKKIDRFQSQAFETVTQFKDWILSQP